MSATPDLYKPVMALRNGSDLTAGKPARPLAQCLDIEIFAPDWLGLILTLAPIFTVWVFCGMISSRMTFKRLVKIHLLKANTMMTAHAQQLLYNSSHLANWKPAPHIYNHSQRVKERRAINPSQQFWGEVRCPTTTSDKRMSKCVGLWNSSCENFAIILFKSLIPWKRVSHLPWTANGISQWNASTSGRNDAFCAQLCELLA